MDKSTQKLIRGEFLKIMLNNMLLMISISVCGLIDNLFIGRMLGKNALAAVGFFSPVAVAVGFSYVIILGTQTLTGNFVGAGKTKEVRQLFVSSFIVLTLLSGVLSVLCLVFNTELAHILGADGKAFRLLCDYTKGYAPGIVPQVLTAMLMALCPFNNDLKRSYFSIGAMIAGNLIGDALFIMPLGLFGIGLASTVSSTASFLVLLPGFFRKNRLFRFSLNDSLNLNLVVEAAKRGLPSLMLSFGVIIKNYCFNYSLNNYIGADGVAVAGIMATVSALTGAVPAGCYNSYSALAGICWGEEDRESLTGLTRIALRYGMLFCAATTALIMVLSFPLARLFIPDDGSVQALASRMFIITFTYLVPNVIYNIFLQAYRAQNRMKLVNIMSFAETAMIGLFTLFAVKPLGADAAWISNTVIDVLCIVIVLISVVVYKKTIDLSLPALLKLPDSFGAKENEYLTFSATSINDVTDISERVTEFCLGHNYSNIISNRVGLCIEEMAGNVISHGFATKKKCYADIRIVSKSEELTVRIRDNCREFDPRKRAETYDADHPEKNIGIRLSVKAARQIDYYNNAGVNTLIMKF